MTSSSRALATFVDRDIRRLVRRSRRLGARPVLVVHGGGNTSTKSRGVDHLGRERRILLIKASGTDLATIGPTGFTQLYLDELLPLAARRTMSDEEMVDFLGRCLVRPDMPRPSIETLLHGFLPARHVDHVHADAICALTNGPHAANNVREALGDRVAFVDWVRPGFSLAKRVARLAGAEAVVLGHHGLVTWGETPEESVRTTLRLVARADSYLRRASRAIRHRVTAPRRGSLSANEVTDLLLGIRGRLSQDRRVLLYVDRGTRNVVDRGDIARIARAGPATADHLIRTRPWPAVATSVVRVSDAIGRVESRYRTYWQGHRARAPRGYTMGDPLPSVVLVPGLGTVAAGRTVASARAVAEVASHTLRVAARTLDAFGSVRALPPKDLFDIEYWPLELAKLRDRSSSPELEGRVILVTGAGRGIGRVVAAMLARLGAQLVLNDVDRSSLEITTREIARSGPTPLAIAGDVTRPGLFDLMIRRSILAFGGIDGAVSNAGIAVTGRLSDVSQRDWERSLAVNLTAHFLLTRRLLPVLKRQGLGGSLVYVASKNAFSPGAGFGPYSIAKAAEVQLARLAALEGGAFGVRANVVSPDAVFRGSGLWSAGLRAARAKAHGIPVAAIERFYAERSLLRVAVRAEDVAEAVAFCLSDRSSRTTGCVITVDGGVPSAFPR